MIGGSYNQMNKPFSIPAPYNAETAVDAYCRVLNRAGASLVRDAADERVIREVNDCNGILPDVQDDVGGWPTLTQDSRPIEFDIDRDGMPGNWEIQRRLDPKHQ